MLSLISWAGKENAARSLAVDIPLRTLYQKLRLVHPATSWRPVTRTENAGCQGRFRHSEGPFGHSEETWPKWTHASHWPESAAAFPGALHLCDCDTLRSPQLRGIGNYNEHSLQNGEHASSQSTNTTGKSYWSWHFIALIPLQLHLCHKFRQASWPSRFSWLMAFANLFSIILRGTSFKRNEPKEQKKQVWTGFKASQLAIWASPAWPSFRTFILDASCSTMQSLKALQSAVGAAGTWPSFGFIVLSLPSALILDESCKGLEMERGI